MASEKITAIIESVKALTVLELSELVKAIEEEFGVSAAAPVAVMGGAAAAAPAEEEKMCIRDRYCRFCRKHTLHRETK